ncbi:MAG TPA: alcohol dehydrogenase catalytic domain-containing protein, partial [bacterium]|nr:alcohol dehydrogenase catalytic domain-containing protein [bacterium]
MKAVRVYEHGDVDKLIHEEIEIPRVGPNEVLIQVKACALNHIDLWVREGLPTMKFPLPLILGADIAGIVAEVGEVVHHLNIGDAVVVSPGVGCGHCQMCLWGQDHLCREYRVIGEIRDGGYAEYTAVPGNNVVPMPTNLSFEEAAGIPLVFITAWNMLINKAKVKAGEDVLILAAGSGVGSAGVQIAKFAGARVIATAGSDEKLARARELGADEVINYSRVDFLQEV